MLEREYSDMRAYTQSKLAQIMFTFDLAQELYGTGVTVNSLHPATFMDTNMVASLGVEPRTTVAERAEAVMHLHLFTTPDLESGQFFNGMIIGPGLRRGSQRAVADAQPAPDGRRLSD